MRERVAIIGGGVGGLSAAHELVERGFTVDVYERRRLFGGKAASFRVRHKRSVDATTDPEGAVAGATVPSSRPHSAAADGLPGEHGFRFFPGWYRHLTDTMARIPYQRPGGGLYQGGTVADNLIGVESNLLAWFDRSPVALPLHVPRSATEAGMASHFLTEFGSLGLSPGEIALFFRKLIEFVALPESRRIELLEGVTWWDYLECSRPERSRAYKDLVRATTRTMVAAKAEQASAFSIGRLAVRTLLDTVSSLDRVLNGPTNEVWIEPWVKHLESRGVTFHREVELQSIRFDGASRRVKGVELEPVAVANARRLRNLIARRRLAKTASPWDSDAHAGDLANDLLDSEWLGDLLSETDERYRDALTRAQAYLGAGEAPDGEPVDIEALVPLLEQMESDAKATREVAADYFVLALPLEQLAYLVNRTTMLTFLAPELRKVVKLTRHMDWMAGIQFYLEAPVDIAPGHLVGLDSSWGLTAIEQTQFWRHVTLPREVKGVLSVDISAWDQRGRQIRKEAFNCTDQEIAEEVWAQLSEMLNRPGRPAVLRPDMLRGGALEKGVSFHLDENIVELRDRKKQALYERGRGVQFSTLALIQEGEDADESGAVIEDTYMWGPRRRFNAEPLLVNRVGSRKLRPEAHTSIPNLFLAADYVKTETDLACMEGANEAARRAVNGILDACGSREPRCELWTFSPTRQLAGALSALVDARRQLDNAASAVSGIKNRFWKSLAGGLMRVQNGATGASYRGGRLP